MGIYSTALGQGAKATKNNTTAVGQGATATGLRATAFGQSANASRDDTTAIGRIATALGVSSTAVGHNTRASGDGATAVGQFAYATANGATAVGQGTNAIGVRSTVVGQSAKSTLGNAVAIGHGAQTLGANSSVVGKGASASERDSVAIGHLARVTALDAVAIGADAIVNKDGGIAIGRHAFAGSLTVYPATGAIAIGRSARATYNDAIAIGRDVTAGESRYSHGQIRIGNVNQSDVRIGAYNLFNLLGDQLPQESPPRIPEPPRPPIQSEVDGASAGVRGAEAKAKSPIAQAGGIEVDHSRRSTNSEGTIQVGVNGSAYGYGATAATNSVAIGADASAEGEGGIAIGHGVVVGGENIAIGRNHVQGVRIGAYDIAALNAAIGTYTDTASHSETASAHARINKNRYDIGKSREEYRKGIAMAMAQQFLPVEKDSRARFGMTSSGYRGEFGIGVSAGVRLTDRIQFHLSGAADTGFDEKAFKTGFDIQFK